MYFRKQPYVEYPDGFDTKLEVGQVFLLQDFFDDGVSGGTWNSVREEGRDSRGRLIPLR